MSHSESSFVLPLRGEVALARGWLFLALAALVIAGLLTILVVSARAPLLQDLLPVVDLFRSVLVVHVDLTVLVWFATFGGLFWTLAVPGGCRLCGWAALLLAWCGALLMAAALFVAHPAPVMSNYIPVLRNAPFFVGLLTFAAGFALLVLRSLAALVRARDWRGADGALRVGLLTAALAGAAALAVFAASYFTLNREHAPQAYYELLFWGGGHLMQFVYTQLMLVTWLCLAVASGALPRIGARGAGIAFGVGVAAILLTPFFILGNGPESAQYRLFFTRQMEYGGGVAALIIGAAVLLGLLRAPAASSTTRAERNALWASMLVFGAGGGIGFAISGSNVTIPAHYHGNIVGVTLAFMGMAYHLLPKLGYRPVGQRLAVWQARIYCFGQLLHITGLAWSGGYGVQRKTAGAAQALDSAERVAAMGLMGVGGLIAIVGGVLFLVVVFRSMWRRGAESGSATQPVL